MWKAAEVAANVAVIAVGLTFGIRAVTSTPPPKRAGFIKIGEPVSIPRVQLAGDGRSTLLVVIRKSCEYCEKSLPFYSALTKAADHRKVRFVVLSPDERESTAENLTSHGIAADEVAQVAWKDLWEHLRVRGTPTAVLINPSGAVVNYWEGELHEAGERQVSAATK